MTNLKSISIHENQFLPEYDEYYKIRKNMSTKKETEEMKLLNIMIDNGGKVIVENET